jgi:hypothetical protein
VVGFRAQGDAGRPGREARRRVKAGLADAASGRSAKRGYPEMGVGPHRFAPYRELASGDALSGLATGVKYPPKFAVLLTG